jgi:TPR repeat protein
MAAARDIRAEADGGSASAQNELAAALEYGRGMPRDARRAAHYYQLSADQRDPIGAFNYGRVLEHGLGVNRNFKSAVVYYRVAAEGGNPSAMCALGRIAQRDNDYKTAAQYLRQAADAGDTEGQSRYGIFLQNDTSAGPNRFRDAANYLRQSADAGNSFAQVALGQLLERGEKGVNKDPRAALRYYRLAADQRNRDGQFYLGRMLENGYGCKKNRDQAMRNYQWAADAGHPGALSALAAIRTAEGNPADAAPLLKRAAEAGSPAAMLEFAKSVENQEPEEAAKYVQKAASQGHLESQVTWARYLMTGTGCQRSDAEGIRVLRTAASRGSAEAMFQLANLLKTGRGCAKDEVEAMRMLEMAAKNGWGPAQEIVTKLRDKNRTEQQIAAEKAAEEERLQRIHAEKSRRKVDEDEQKRGRPKSGRGIPTQGEPKSAPKAPPPAPTQPQTPAAGASVEVRAVKGGVVEEGEAKSFIETKEEQRAHGGPKAQLKLARHFLEPGTKDLTLAYHFLKLAAEKLPPAILLLSEMLAKGEIGDPIGQRKPEAAKHYLALGSRRGDIGCMLKLSEMHATGAGLELDPMESVRYLKMAADSGDGESRMRFAAMLQNGEIVKKNPVMAAEYVKKAADAKFLPAQLEMIARLRAEGGDEFIAYLRGAGESGHVPSLLELGRRYVVGDGVPIDLGRAKRFLGLAAEKGGDEERAEYQAFLDGPGSQKAAGDAPKPDEQPPQEPPAPDPAESS